MESHPGKENIKQNEVKQKKIKEPPRTAVRRAAGAHSGLRVTDPGVEVGRLKRRGSARGFKALSAFLANSSSEVAGSRAAGCKSGPEATRLPCWLR